MKARIDADIKDAMKSGHTMKRDVLRVVKGEIARKFDAGADITDEDVLSVIKGMVKNNNITLDEVPDLGLTRENEILSEYLPTQLAGSDLQDILKAIVADGNYSSIKDMGKIMADFNKSYADQADGKTISEVAKKMLT